MGRRSTPSPPKGPPKGSPSPPPKGAPAAGDDLYSQVVGAFRLTCHLWPERFHLCRGAGGGYLLCWRRTASTAQWGLLMMLSDDPQHGAHVAVAFQRRRECHHGTGHAVDWCEPLPPAARDAARTAATIPVGEAIMPVDAGVLGHVGDVIAWAVGQTGWAPI